MEIQSRLEGPVQILAISGHLDTKTAPSAETTLNDLIAKGQTSILIDCEKLDYISSVGLRVLLSTMKKLKKANGKLHLSAMNPTVKEVFVISGFSNIFSIFDTTPQALAAY